jgi:hypothetical protein
MYMYEEKAGTSTAKNKDNIVKTGDQRNLAVPWVHTRGLTHVNPTPQFTESPAHPLRAFGFLESKLLSPQCIVVTVSGVCQASFSWV